MNRDGRVMWFGDLSEAVMIGQSMANEIIGYQRRAVYLVQMGCEIGIFRYKPKHRVMMTIHPNKVEKSANTKKLKPVADRVYMPTWRHHMRRTRYLRYTNNMFK